MAYFHYVRKLTQYTKQRVRETVVKIRTDFKEVIRSYRCGDWTCHTSTDNITEHQVDSTYTCIYVGYCTDYFF